MHPIFPLLSFGLSSSSFPLGCDSPALLDQHQSSSFLRFLFFRQLNPSHTLNGVLSIDDGYTPSGVRDHRARDILQRKRSPSINVVSLHALESYGESTSHAQNVCLTDIQNAAIILRNKNLSRKRKIQDFTFFFNRQFVIPCLAVLMWVVLWTNYRGQTLKSLI